MAKVVLEWALIIRQPKVLKLNECKCEKCLLFLFGWMERFGL